MLSFYTALWFTWYYAKRDTSVEGSVCSKCDFESRNCEQHAIVVSLKPKLDVNVNVNVNIEFI